MKSSKYNFFIDIDDNEILAYNGISGALVKMDKKSYNEYQRLITVPDAKKHTLTPELWNYLRELKKARFVVDDDFNELDYIKSQYNAHRYNSEESTIVIYPTSDCNFNCIYCLRGAKKKPDYMTKTVEYKVLNYVSTFTKKFPKVKVGWSGGEPTLALDTVCRLSKKLMEIAHKRGQLYYSGITTNGYLLSREKALKLKACGISDAAITIDGPPEIHNLRRPLRNGNNTFHVILQNVKQIADILNLVLLTFLDKQNIDSFPQLLSLYEKEGLKGEVVIRYDRVRACNWLGEMPNPILSNQEYATISTHLNGLMIEHDFACDFGLRPHWNGRCSAVNSGSICITPTGDLYKCQSLEGDEQERVGNVCEVQRNVDQNSVKWLTWDPFVREECRDCDVLPLCMGGCPLNEIAIKRRIAPFDSPRVCSTFKYNLRKMLLLFYYQKRGQIRQFTAFQNN